VIDFRHKDEREALDMCEADMYRVYTGDWSGDSFRYELSRFLRKRTGYSESDIEAYLDAEEAFDLFEDVIGEKDIIVTISERAQISVFMVMLLVEAREKFIEDISHSYRIYADMMYA
jgi:hypothetical protein